MQYDRQVLYSRDHGGYYYLLPTTTYYYLLTTTYHHHLFQILELIISDCQARSEIEKYISTPKAIPKWNPLSYPEIGIKIFKSHLLTYLIILAGYPY